jgi:hypothetical protein
VEEPMPFDKMLPIVSHLHGGNEDGAASAVESSDNVVSMLGNLEVKRWCDSH